MVYESGQHGSALSDARTGEILFRTFAEAEQAVSQVRKAGFSSAFVIAFDGGQPLSLSKAKQKESSVKVVTEEFKIVK